MFRPMKKEQLDLLLMTVNSMADKDKDELRQVLKVSAKKEHPCKKNGHKYKVITYIRWILPPGEKLVCTACGEQKRVK